MKRAIEMMVAMPSLACALILASAVGMPAAAQDTQDTRLKGQYAASGSSACLTAPGGFNNSLQPNVPSDSWSGSTSTEGLRTFNGAGKGTIQNTDVSIGPPPTPSSFPPSASSNTTSGSLTYAVGAHNKVTVTISNLMGTELTGPRTGQTFVIDRIVSAGYLSADNKTLTLATPTTAVETITYSNGDSYPRICHRSRVLVKVGS